MGEDLKDQGCDLVKTHYGKVMPQTRWLEEVEGTCLVTVKDKTCLLLPVCTQTTGLLFLHLTQARLPTFLESTFTHPSLCMKSCLCCPAELAAQGQMCLGTAGFGGQSFMIHVSMSPWDLWCSSQMALASFLSLCINCFLHLAA